MNKRLSLDSVMPSLVSVLAIASAFVTGAVYLWLMDKDPIGGYTLLFKRGLGTSLGITETLIVAAPLLMVSAGLLVALKAGVWNIGIDGQFLVGACLVGVTAPYLAGMLPPGLMLLACADVGILGGALWGVVPALLKVRYGLNEIITTIMMNYVAIYLTSWLVKGPFKDQSVVPPQTPLIPKDFRLPAIPTTRIHVGLLVGIILVFLAFLLYRNTVVGFQLTVLGKNRKAAIHAGMPVNRLTVLAFLVSAGLAGLAGANDVLGVKGMFQGEWNPAYGLTGFALVFLARLTGPLILPFAYFFALLHFGGEMMARTAQIPVFFVGILEGLMLVFLAVGAYVERRIRTRSGAT
jgi:ABC-type uncharacterized transport system permease subunit